MIVTQLSDLVDQPLNGWQLKQWYRVYKQRPTNGSSRPRKLEAVFRYRAAAQAFQRVHHNITIVPFMVLVNNQVVLDVQTEKQIKQTPEWIAADAAVQQQEQQRQQALAKLTPAERRLLGI